MLLTAEELKRSSEVDPTIEEFIKANPRPNLQLGDYVATQNMIAGFERMTNESLGELESTLTEYYIDINLRDGTPSRLKVVRPSTPPQEGSPLITLLFGGGFCAGTEEQMTPYARGFARAFGAVVVCPKYRVAPQHPFPAQQLDSFDGIKWAAAHAAELHADPTKGFVVGGVSAGGNCAASVVRMAQDEPLAYPITGQWLSIPSIFEASVVPQKYKSNFISREQNANAHVLNEEALEAIRKYTKWDSDSPIRFPTLSKAPLSELPPTFTQVCGMDPLRDDGLIYDEMLKEAGVKTRINLYQGCPHGHWTTFKGLEISRQGFKDVMTGLGWLLGKEISEEEGLKALAIPGV
ncbi:hypothetical protein PRZ48_004199 [Zasmidium cellare]|uniref:Alpha/beta hydrolase fold-3 domain-containing protein n=1 Tax=Zasmidium cellare TaxID=395010 RepID=A0ABR0EXY2_ZASCE|nr:hypothetical protein PRZ48_004199 [Zasmidium cellare]